MPTILTILIYLYIFKRGLSHVSPHLTRLGRASAGLVPHGRVSATLACPWHARPPKPPLGYEGVRPPARRALTRPHPPLAEVSLLGTVLTPSGRSLTRKWSEGSLSPACHRLSPAQHLVGCMRDSLVAGLPSDLPALTACHGLSARSPSAILALATDSLRASDFSA